MHRRVPSRRRHACSSPLPTPTSQDTVFKERPAPRFGPDEDLQLIKMAGDGNCLFHALAYNEGEDGAALRAAVAEFLVEEALNQGVVADAWLEESDMLQSDPARCWGGEVSIVAWTLLKRRRAIVYWTDDEGVPRKGEKTHPQVLVDVEEEGEEPPVTRLFYNGKDHYDLLVPSSSHRSDDISPQGPASSQPAQRDGRARAGPPLRPLAAKKAKAAQPKPKAPPPMPRVPEGQEAGERRDSEEQQEEEERCEDVLEELSRGPVAAASEHPRRALEDLIKQLAEERLREHPTLPPHATPDGVDSGELWPRAFCAFEGCPWTRPDGAEEDLQRHLLKEHREHLEPLVHQLNHVQPNVKDAFRSVYNEAVAVKCRGQAPLAGCSLDRTALRSFAKATAGDNVEALICFSCACIHTRVAETEEQGPIKWCRPLRSREAGGHTFLERPLPEILDRVGLDAFLQKYDQLQGDLKLTAFEDFSQWRVQVPLGETGAFLLCCPEDHRCDEHPEHPGEGVLCEHCEVPMCSQCHQDLRKGALPPLSLANDMWTGYAPERLYREKVTVMEMICASPCVTTLLCMSMEARYRYEATPLDGEAHMARQGLGARGNALTFPLPWEDLLHNLQAHEAATLQADGALGLPRKGEALGAVVRVLLKTNKSGKTTADEIKNLIHQANVRREVVVQLILDMKRLGHPSFQRAEEEAVRQAAAELPEDGVPPQVLKVVTELDEASEDKLLPQKAATPADGMQELDRAGAVFAAQRARGVVAEGQNMDAQDQNAVSAAALNDLKEELEPQQERSAQTLEIRTGNVLLDQFQPLYFATAFCFCFKHATACPDVVNTVHGPNATRRRRSRDETAPEVSVHSWAAAMLRRAEAQFRRDWTFGFTVWNYLFRTMINLQGNAFMHTVPDEETGGRRALTNEEIHKGVCEIQRLMCTGKYRDVSGELKAVKGDLSKVRYVHGLSNAAKRVLDNCEARTRNVPGTHEVRKTMRHQTHANRVCYGTALFLTFSPSERDTCLMLRLARVRQSDPALAHDDSKPFQTRDKPDLETEYLRLSPEALAATLPPYDERRAMLARDPLACAEGFKTLVQLTMRHLFGVRCCPHCPSCGSSDTPCTDAFGSNATAFGGVLGRVDAVYGSIECQKAGTLHVHFQAGSVVVRSRVQRVRKPARVAVAPRRAAGLRAVLPPVQRARRPRRARRGQENHAAAAVQRLRGPRAAQRLLRPGSLV